MNFSQIIQDPVNVIIKPPKMRWSEEDWPVNFTFEKFKSERQFFHFKNNKNLTLKGVAYHPMANSSPITLFYFHTLGSNCLEAKFLGRVCCFLQM